MTSIAINKDIEAFTDQLIDRAIDLAILEDMGPNAIDLTTDSIVGQDQKAEAAVILKEAATIAGMDIFCRVINRFAGEEPMQFIFLVDEGKSIEVAPSHIMKISGPAVSILKGERLALNLLQRMSAVATNTARFLEELKDTEIKLVDTRKTLPGMRVFDKIAVRAAGANNHRFGLFDSILIKDNHIRAAGSLSEAVRRVRSALPQESIQVEVFDLAQLQEALAMGVDSVLLDNMTPETVRECLAIAGDDLVIEISGGIKLDNIKQYILDGVHRISVGALTHSAPSVDISLDISLLR